MRIEAGIGGRSIQEIGSRARMLEELGYDGILSAETGHDPFFPLVIAAEHTERVTLGTGVAIAFPRSPFVTAQIAWDLQDLSGGRFSLGLGTQVKGHNERRYSTPWTAPPGPRMREYILCLRAIFQTFQNGARPSFMGQHYQFTLMSPFFNPGPIQHPDVPIYISAVNKYMARLAGELCQGIRLHGFNTVKYTREVLLPSIKAGAAKAGRSLAEIDVVGAPLIVTGRDEEEMEKAKGPVKQQIAFYGSTRTYLPVLEAHGWGEVGLKLHRLSLEGKWADMAQMITDDMVEEFAVVAPYAELAGRIKERWGGIATTLTFGLAPATAAVGERLKGLIQELKRA